jgi:hypothetical protein
MISGELICTQYEGGLCVSQMVDFYGLCQILHFGLNALMDGVS